MKPMIMNAMIKSLGPTLGLMLCLLFPQSGQCFYNPSTGRWLSRDPIGRRGGPNPYGFAKGNPPCVVDSDGRITFTEVKHVLHRCGGAEVTWSFHLDGAAPGDGYFVPKVTYPPRSA